MNGVPTTRWPTGARTTAEEHVEDVKRIMETEVPAPALFQSLLSALVVYIPLFWIRQDFKGL